MTLPIAVQLYTVREALARDFTAVVQQIADTGYLGVEPFPFTAVTPVEAGKLFRDLGLAVPSAHLPLPIGERKNEVLDMATAWGTKRVVSGGIGPEHFQSISRIKRACEQFNEANRAALENGMAFGIHNHWWEFEQVEGRPAYEVMLEELDPAIFFEVDTYWVKTAGADPTAVIRQLGDRVPLLHIKDGPCVQGEPMTAVGQGTLDFRPMIEAAEAAEWLIVELDACATDMLEAVEQSYQYLIAEGLAHGKN